MNIILLSGGSGQRLWPLSNNVRSKQFLKVLKNEDGEAESMVQRVYRQIITVDPEAEVTIATGKKQVSMIRNQLENKVNICVEPERRDTFPAICLAAAYLHDEKGVGTDEAVVVCPVDPYVDNTYFEALKELSTLAAKGDADMNLLGIEPTYPSEKYGYIIPESKERVSAVKTFREKPDEETARKYLEQGALWNGGVFAFRLGYLLDKAHELMDFEDYRDLYAHYAEQKKISFDYAVVEKEKSLQVLRYCGSWKDLGTWKTLTEAMGSKTVGNVTLNDTCVDTHVVNELNVPLLCMGVKELIVAASADGILITDKERSGYIKPYVDGIEQQIMFAEKSWGSYQVLDVEHDSLTIKVKLNAGHSMNYHRHEHRNEVWTVLSGEGRVTLDGVERIVRPGDVIDLPAGCKHTVFALQELTLIEVQLGKEITVLDKIKEPLP